MQTQDNAQFHIVLVKGWVKKEDKYLLARRSATEVHAPGVWSLPGGKVENEDEKNILQKTLYKEIEEEVGLQISDKIELIYNNSFTRDDNAHVIGLTFLCHFLSGDAAPLEDTTEIKWLSIEELKGLSDIKPFLQIEIEYLANYLNRSN